jgi:glutathione synthase/RimK-type ligase-like ATP-grasp enzyme
MKGTIAFATSAAYATLTDDDHIAVDALRRAGWRVEALVWSEPAAARPLADAVVLRSCWDYHLHPRAFSRWVQGLADAGTPLLNPAAQVHWNLHKGYLLELARDGVALPPTQLVHAASPRTLQALAAELGTADLVVKPAVSASAYGTWRTVRIGAAQEQRFARQLAHGDLLVQRYIPEIADGELSLLYFGGRYSHAVRKTPATGDFRVQVGHGGTHCAWQPDEAILAAAGDIVARCAAGALYCRIDGVPTADGFLLMEVELIDPVLFFEHAPGAADAFVDALQRRIAAPRDATAGRALGVAG